MTEGTKNPSANHYTIGQTEVLSLNNDAKLRIKIETSKFFEEKMHFIGFFSFDKGYCFSEVLRQMFEVLDHLTANVGQMAEDFGQCYVVI